MPRARLCNRVRRHGYDAGRYVRRHVGYADGRPDRHVSRRGRALRHGRVESRHAVAQRRRRLRIHRSQDHRLQPHASQRPRLQRLRRFRNPARDRRDSRRSGERRAAVLARRRRERSRMVCGILGRSRDSHRAERDDADGNRALYVSGHVASESALQRIVESSRRHRRAPAHRRPRRDLRLGLQRLLLWNARSLQRVLRRALRPAVSPVWYLARSAYLPGIGRLRRARDRRLGDLRRDEQPQRHRQSRALLR